MNERESEMVRTKKVSILAVVANQQGTELIDPRKAPFRREALFVNGRIEQAFPSAFGRFAAAFVLSNVSKALSALKNALETAIRTPFLEMIVDRLPAGMQTIQDVKHECSSALTLNPSP